MLVKPSAQRARRIGLIALALVALQAGVLIVYRTVTNHRARPDSAFQTERLDGRVAPEPMLRTGDGSAVSWHALRGKPVLLHFWATWCTPCRDELPALLELGRTERERLHLVAVSLDSDWPPVHLFFGGPIPPQVSRPADGELKRRYGVTTLPDTFVISSSGKLIERARGARDWRSARVRQRLQAWAASP
jgi:thiol-disulfide isomerase/thioredoxin